MFIRHKQEQELLLREFCLYFSLFLVVFYTMEYFFRLLRGSSNRFFIETWISNPLDDSLFFWAIPFGSCFPGLGCFNCSFTASFLSLSQFYATTMLFCSSASRLKPSLVPTSFPRGDCYGAASHPTPSQIERREFYNGIIDTVIKTAALKKSITLPSRSGDALCR